MTVEMALSVNHMPANKNKKMLQFITQLSHLYTTNLQKQIHFLNFLNVNQC